MALLPALYQMVQGQKRELTTSYQTSVNLEVYILKYESTLKNLSDASLPAILQRSKQKRWQAGRQRALKLAIVFYCEGGTEPTTKQMIDF